MRATITSCAALATLALVLLLPASPASATWSILAVDDETGRVGAALASCVPAAVLGDRDEVLVPIVLVPGVGGAVAQGTIDAFSPPELRRLLDEGARPQQVIDEVLADDEEPTARQYAVAVFDAGGANRVAAHTGVDTEFERGSRLQDGAAVQGVLLRDEAVLDDTLAAFNRARAEGLALEQALVEALAAGADAGGDRRCFEQKALFAQVAVVEPGDDPLSPELLVTVTVDQDDGQEPVAMLAQAVAEGRTGWIEAGQDRPAGIQRWAVAVVAVIMAAAAVWLIRTGLGSPSARR